MKKKITFAFLFALLLLVMPLCVSAEDVPENLPYLDNDTAAYISYSGLDENSGYYANEARKTFSGTISLLEDGGRFVVCGKAYLGTDYVLPKCEGTLLITSNDGKKNYMKSEPMNNPACAFKMASGKSLTINGNVIFDDIIVFQEYEQNSIIVEDGATLVIGDGVVNMTRREYQTKIVVNEGGKLIVGGGDFGIVNNGGEVIEYAYDYDNTKAQVSWDISEDGILTLSGSGAISDYAYGNAAPWKEYASDIKKIVIGEGITKIGTMAFFGLTSVEEISLPDTLAGIFDLAFFNCSSLAKVTLPENVRFVDTSAFEHCQGMTAFEVAEENAYFAADGGVLFDKDLTKLIKYPDGIAAQSYVVPGSVNKIGEYAFDNCWHLQSVILHSGIDSIGKGAFSECSSLFSMVIPEGITEIPEKAFYMCAWLKEVTIPSTVVTIGDEAFFYCTWLETLTLPEALVSIGDYAFKYCDLLTTVNIPANVEEIGEGAFGACEKLTGFTVDTKNTALKAVDGILFNADETVLYAFPAGKETTEYTLPASVSVIHGGAFYECENLARVDTVKVCTIGASAFSSCTSLETVVLSGNLSSLGDLAFYRCSALKDVISYSKHVTFGLGVFEMCAEDVVISCVNGSLMLDFAQKNGFAYRIIGGDINRDGIYSMADVLVTLKGMLDGHYANEVDVTCNGKLELIDIIKMMKQCCEN